MPPGRLARLAPAAVLLVLLPACRPDASPPNADGLAPLSTDAHEEPVGVVRLEPTVTSLSPPVSPAEAFDDARATADATFQDLARRGDCAGLADQEQFWRDRTTVAATDVAALATELAQRAADVRRFIGCPPPR